MQDKRTNNVLISVCFKANSEKIVSRCHFQNYCKPVKLDFEMWSFFKTMNFFHSLTWIVFSLNLTGPSKLIHIMHNTEQPLTSYAITDSGICLVADTVFDGMMQRLKTFYTPRKSSRIEAKGQRYELGDFVVKLGVISIGAHSRGIIIEVWWLDPVYDFKDCLWNVCHCVQTSVQGVFEFPPPKKKRKKRVTNPPKLGAKNNS